MNEQGGTSVLHPKGGRQELKNINFWAPNAENVFPDMRQRRGEKCDQVASTRMADCSSTG